MIPNAAGTEQVRIEAVLDVGFQKAMPVEELHTQYLPLGRLQRLDSP